MLEFVNVVFERSLLSFEVKKIGTFGNGIVDSGPNL